MAMTRSLPSTSIKLRYCKQPEVDLAVVDLAGHRLEARALEVRLQVKTGRLLADPVAVPGTVLDLLRSR